jgi:hypothetical protein
MTYRNFTIALILGGLIGLLLWLIGRRRDREYEYPDEPEPMKPWWTTTSAIPMEEVYSWMVS